jgi:N4-gp56 family major capsid protein
MAEFIKGTGGATTPIQHKAEIFKNYLKQISLVGMMGKKGSGKPIIVDDTLKGKKGETLRFEFIPQNDTDGIAGQNATITGNEDDLTEYYMDLTVDQLAKAFARKGKMTDRRCIWDFRAEAKQQLINWWAQTSEDLLFWAATGWVSGAAPSSLTALRTQMFDRTDTTDLVAGAGRCIRASGGNSSADVTAANSDNTAVYAAMSAGDKISPRLIEDAVVVAKTGGTYKLRPVKVGPNGEEFFILYLHTKTARDLRFHPDWQNRALKASEAGLDKDPIATGALGIWNNVIVKESERIVTMGLAGTKVFARNLLFGADAVALGWAQTLDYVEELRDYNRIMGINSDEIRGQKKLAFNSVDLGVVQVLAQAM